MVSRVSNHRLSFVVVIGIILWGGLGLRLAYIQIYERELYRMRANDQQRRIITLTPRRGRIFDRNLETLALSVEFESFGLHKTNEMPISDEDLADFAIQLAQVTDQDHDELINRLVQASGFVYLAKEVTSDISDRIKSLPEYSTLQSHIQIEKSERRIYPHSNNVGQILGFSVDGSGRAGFEREYDRILQGVEGYSVVQVDAQGRAYSRVESDFRPAKDGTNVMLTIDLASQAVAEEILEKTVEHHDALGGMIIVMKPSTGEILAMASSPDFDPNIPNRFTFDSQKIRPVVDMYEPGSTFKIVTAAAALETGAFKLTDRIVTNNGRITIGSQTITDHDVFEELSVQEVIEHSSNVGTIIMAQRLGEKSLFEYSRAFGFGIRTGIELPGEAKGILHNPVDWSLTTLPTMAIGYGVSVTGLQLAGAYCAVANGGLLVEPRIIKALIHSDGTIEHTTPNVVRRVITEETADRLLQALTGVVERGTGKEAAINGFKTAGKTGTAWKAKEGVAGYTRDYRSSFAGIFPADKPELVALIMIDDPKEGGFYGGSVAAPAFRRLVERMIHLPDGPIKATPESEDGLPIYLAELRQQFATAAVEEDDMMEENRDIQKSVLPIRDLEIYGKPIQKNDDEQILMPTVEGLSIRQAIKKLAEAGIEATVEGHGYVMRQIPTAGRPVMSDNQCLLECRPLAAVADLPGN